MLVVSKEAIIIGKTCCLMSSEGVFFSTKSIFCKSISGTCGVTVCVNNQSIHDGVRQASDPWTVAVSSLLALISRESARPVWDMLKVH